MVQFLRLDDFVLLLTVAISIAIGTANGDDCPKDDDSDCECEMRSGLVSLDCTGKDFIGLPSLLNLQVRDTVCFFQSVFQILSFQFPDNCTHHRYV